MLISAGKKKMKAGPTSPCVAVTTLWLLLWFGSPASGAYNTGFCSLKTKTGTEVTGSVTPFFFDDYSLLNEAAFIKVENVSEAKVIHQQLYYSKSKNQVVLNEDTPLDNFWVFVDQASEDCIYKRGGGQCTAEEGDCTETAERVGFGYKKDGKIVIGSPSERMIYPTNIKKTVSFGPSMVRGMKTNKFGICSYEEDTDQTFVTIFHVLDPKSYPNMDQTQKILLSLARFGKQPGAKNSMLRLDFTDYTKLLPSQLINGFRLGESRCGTVRSTFTTRKTPQPTVRFSFVNNLLATDTDLVRAKTIISERQEFNLNAQLASSIRDEPVDDQTEKNTVMRLEDYRGGLFYTYSLTNGACNVTTLTQKLQTDRQLSPQQLWGLDLENPTYLGVYENRDIPCDVWEFNGRSADEKSVTLYTATNDWLDKQGYDKDFFFPVERIERGNKANFYEIYAFKDNPGYRIPFLPNCYQEDDMVWGELTLMMNFNIEIAHRAIHFEYEFRSLLMKVTGIKSPVRIGGIVATPSQTAPNKETTVLFKILGKLVGYDDASAAVYKKDPVTNQQAVKTIRKQVDAGNLRFTLDGKTISINFKKGSFAISESRERYQFVDSIGVTSGYSSGTMAGVAIALLVVCLALGVAAVFAYKRFSGGAGSGISLGMKSLEEEA